MHRVCMCPSPRQLQVDRKNKTYILLWNMVMICHRHWYYSQGHTAACHNMTIVNREKSRKKNRWNEKKKHLNVIIFYTVEYYNRRTLSSRVYRTTHTNTHAH